MTSHRARPVVTAILGLAIVGATATPASAHAAYKGSDPADESSVSSAPSQIWAEFTEPPSSASYMEVFDPCGEQVDAGDSRPDGYKLYVGMSGEKAGTYRVTFFVNSATDTHNTRGEFTFTASNGESCPGEEPPEAKHPRQREREQPENTSGDGDTDGGAASVSDSDQGDNNSGSTDDGQQQSGGQPEASSGGRQRDKAEGDPDGDDGVAVAADTPVPEEPGIFSGIPIGGLIVALLMASVIGAGGGLIYAGIMGYRR